MPLANSSACLTLSSDFWLTNACIADEKKVMSLAKQIISNLPNALFYLPAVIVLAFGFTLLRFMDLSKLSKSVENFLASIEGRFPRQRKRVLYALGVGLYTESPVSQYLTSISSNMAKARLVTSRFDEFRATSKRGSTDVESGFSASWPISW